MFIVFPRIRLRISVFALPAFLIMLWLEGALPFVLMLGSALAHEFGHLFMLKLSHRRARRIDILPMGALIVCPEGISDRDEMLIALSGPVASLLCAGISLLVFLWLGSVTALFAFTVNLVLALFNLLPERKLDGGKALYCALSAFKTKEATERYCSVASLISKFLFALFAVVTVALSDFNLGVIVLASVLWVQLLSD